MMAANKFLPDYNSESRRRARKLRRLGSQIVTPRFYPSSPVVRAYWWDGHANFGDALTPWLLGKYGMIPLHTRPSRADVAGVGSILEQLPANYSGAIWGSGLLYGEPMSFPDANVLALRGHLTKQLLGITEDVALGDPGILVSRHLERPEPAWDLGLVPHGFHVDHPMFERLASESSRIRIIDVSQTPGRVLRDISKCGAVLSTSLHGVIVADSFDIPAAWSVLPPELFGGDFKFLDYESVVTPGRTRRFDVDASSTIDDILAAAQRADPQSRAESMQSLELALAHVVGEPSSPLLALRHR